MKRAVTGAFVGTGAQLDVATIGFRPSFVELWNEAGDTAVWCKESMAQDALWKRNAAGAGTFVNSGGITDLSNGFRLGADTDLNVSTEKVHYRAQD
jgi:hypothetical protein